MEKIEIDYTNTVKSVTSVNSDVLETLNASEKNALNSNLAVHLEASERNSNFFLAKKGLYTLASTIMHCYYTGKTKEIAL